ncbi:hypothetical protein KM043_015006 [Ampulex compressa]|nr:hypothetical protein KM043_015006 [Ampulex compressa]
MVLSDLDQIKKNERDRRRRLRLEQVRQQSKEISNRLLERARNVAKEELGKLEKDDKSELKQMHNRKIMEIQQKYQEDMADIGLAHTSAALQPDADVIIENEREKNKAIAIMRGKQAMHCVREAQQVTPQEIHQDRLRQVRELENLRSSMIAKLPEKLSTMENDASKNDRKSQSANLPLNSDTKQTTAPETGTSTYRMNSNVDPDVVATKFSTKTNECENIKNLSDPEVEDKVPRKTIPLSSTSPSKADRIARYNPEDYTQETSEISSSESSTSISDDSSYFSDGVEHSRCIKTPKPHTSLTGSKVQLYDHSTRQRNVYDRPLGVVEKMDLRNEPNAVDAAKEIEQVESIKSQLVKNRKLKAQRRGEDAILRERVRRDYQNLIENLHHLSREERKLKASQIQSYPKDIHACERQRKESQEQRQRKMERMFKSALDQSSSSNHCHQLMERVITLSPKESEDMLDKVPHAVWQDTFCDKDCTKLGKEQDCAKENKKSRDEQILDMLQKVERQKRLLLQEFGVNLPQDILNASMKSLFETQRVEKPPESTPVQQPLSPEIKVINMSGCEENQTKKPKKKNTVPIKKAEIAVQTDRDDKDIIAEDKSIQVELISAEISKTNDSIPRDANVDITKHEPLEPKITIITPEVDDNSNSSTNSTVTGVIIDIDNEKVKVTPKKRKSNIKATKRTPSKMFQKSRSMPVSKMSSPVKRFSRSLPGSHQCSPKKSNYSVTHSPSKRINIHVDKSGFNVEVEPSQETRTVADASVQSSHTVLMNIQEQSTGKPCCFQAQTKRIIKIKDTSDSSTSFASPPPVQPRTILDALTNNTSTVLEMLDSSTNGNMRMLAGNVSPVSTPDTPSPRTMMMPSNIPHPDRISRMLKYHSIESQTIHNSIISSSRNDQSTLTDPFEYPQESITSQQYATTPPSQPSSVSYLCSCKNPECKLLHAKFDDIHNYALRNCPEILKKYEDLQNMCTERIASLTDLIEKVRNEQRGMDFSVISAGDDTSLMQLPAAKPRNDDIQSVRKLVESIEAIHSQLARTLFESQKIVKNEVSIEEETTLNTHIRSLNETTKNGSISGTENNREKTDVAKTKAKPKIISEEEVNIPLHRFKVKQNPERTMKPSTSERNSWSPKPFVHDEDMIEKLSKEILEQSKSLTKVDNTSEVSKEVNVSVTRTKSQPVKNNNHAKRNVSTKLQESSTTTRERYIHESHKEKEFVPLLAGIPKIPRNLGNAIPNSGRGKPPVTLLSAPYRAEIESSGHELSTIVEFDTPDTANKSQTNAKSPSPIKRTAETQVLKSSSIVKPSVHVAPLPILSNHYQTPGKQHSSPSSTKLSPPISAHRSEKTEKSRESPEKLKDIKEHHSLIKNGSEDHTDIGSGKSHKKLQCDVTEQRSLLQADRQPGSPKYSDTNNQHENKEKITSTSSNSFSGLSGISEITSTPSSDMLKYASSPEEMETALKKLGLGWAIVTLKKTREASALSSSSNSDVTPLNTARRMVSLNKKHHDGNNHGLPDLSDVSSISIKEASKSTEQAVLLKGRTSTPKLQDSNSNSERINSTSTNSSENFQEPSDSLTIPNVSLVKSKPTVRQLENL